MNKVFLFSLIVLPFVLTWCNQISKTPSYNQDSRKTTISKDCKSFFDGCNTCNKIENSTEAACTMMYCENYQKPKCLD